MVDLLMETLEKKYMMNPKRRYIGGLSMGGMGTFELVARNPDYFAAAFPICGGGNPVWSNLIKTTPLWIFHGEDDDVVLDNFSRKMYEALSKEKASVRLTIYPEVKHSSWDNAFDEADLMHWLFLRNVENSLNYK